MSHPHIVLIGLMGTGKTTVGRRLARRLGRDFIDTDAEVESRTSRSVRDIFERDGESAFRDIEASVVSDCVTREVPSVIAAAGGAILRDSSRALIRDCETVIWLDAPVELLVSRTASRPGNGHRPLIDSDPAERLSSLKTDREHLYRETSVCRLDVSGFDVDGLVDHIVQDILAMSADSEAPA